MHMIIRHQRHRMQIPGTRTRLTVLCRMEKCPIVLYKMEHRRHRCRIQPALNMEDIIIHPVHMEWMEVDIKNIFSDI